jgi:hypothetical protein
VCGCVVKHRPAFFTHRGGRKREEIEIEKEIDT